VQFEARWTDPDLKEMAQEADPLGSSHAARRIIVDNDRTNQYTGEIYCHLPTETDEERRKPTETDEERRKPTKMEEERRKAKESATRFRWRIIWAPRLYFHNIIKMEDEDKWYRFYDSHLDVASKPPIVCFMWKFRGTFSNPMALVSFPLDFQILTMRLVSGYEHERVKPGSQDNDRRSRTVSKSDMFSEHDRLWRCWHDSERAEQVKSGREKQVKLVKNQKTRYDSTLVTDTFLQAHEYKLYPRLKFVSGQTREENSSSANVYPLLEIQIRVRRYPWNWLFNVVFPLFVLQGSFVTSYAIDTGLADRAGVTITLLLAIIAFRNVVTENLPRISYATLIDLYVLSSFILAALIITDQTCVGIGLCEERRINLVNVSIPFDVGTWTGRRLHSRAHTPAEVHMPAEVEFSATLIHVLCLWLGSHGVIALAILARAIYFYQDEERWLLPEKSLWIGPLKEHAVMTVPDADGGVPLKKATDALHGFLARALELDSARCQIYAWTKEAAGEQYLANKPFVVATFASLHDARKVISYAATIHEDKNLEEEVKRPLHGWLHKCGVSRRKVCMAAREGDALAQPLAPGLEEDARGSSGDNHSSLVMTHTMIITRKLFVLARAVSATPPSIVIVALVLGGPERVRVVLSSSSTRKVPLLQ
jgi:hypothetical protein